MDSSREKKERSTKRDLAQGSGDGEEITRMDTRPGSEMVEGETCIGALW